MANLVGLHDRESKDFSPNDTWILDTIALSENPAPMIYDQNHHWIVRVNWGYGSTGTIPGDPEGQRIFLMRLASYVAASKNCSRWIIGNEPNLAREWPQGRPIYPNQYAEFFKKAREVIKFSLGHHSDEVLIAASGPWNNKFAYADNFKGDWIVYFRDVISALAGDFDGFSLHAYTHGYDVSLVTSQARMGAPFEDRYYNFRAYLDYLNVIPDEYAHLPSYITEANGNDRWQAAGLMPAMTAEIDQYNRRVKNKKIYALIFFRWPKFGDGYEISGKLSVMNEYLRAASLGYQSPLYLPEISAPPAPPAPSAPQATIKALLLNVRDRPGTQGTNIVGSRKQGEKVFILEEKNVDGSLWYKIGNNQWIIAEWTNRAGQSQPDKWTRTRDFTAAWEGDYQNVAWDIGNWTGCAVGVGENKGTKYGVSACSYPNLDIKNLTREQAEKIYYENYWLRSGANELEWPLCLLVFDTAINFGAATASAWLKQSNGNPYIYIALRLRGYRKSQSWPQAGNAWIDRTVDLLLEAGE